VIEGKAGKQGNNGHFFSVFFETNGRQAPRKIGEEERDQGRREEPWLDFSTNVLFGEGNTSPIPALPLLTKKYVRRGRERQADSPGRVRIISMAAPCLANCNYAKRRSQYHSPFFAVQLEPVLFGFPKINTLF
jgi:hypothetical protein